MSASNKISKPLKTVESLSSGQKPDFQIVKSGIPDLSEFQFVKSGIPDLSDFQFLKSGIPDLSEFQFVKSGIPDLSEFQLLKSRIPFFLSLEYQFWAVLRIRIRLIRKILASWIRIQGVKYPPKTAKKTFLLLKPKSKLLKKREVIKFPHL